MLLSPLIYTVNKTSDQMQQYLESTMLTDNPYSMLLNQHKVRVTQNGAGEFFLSTPFRYVHYKIKLTQDVNGMTEIRLKPTMRTFLKASILGAYLISLAIAFLYMPFVMGQTIPLFDILIIIMFPFGYFYNILFGHKQAGPIADAFMKEYIDAIS